MEKSIILNNQVPEGLPCGQFVYCAEGNQNILYADNNVVRLYGCETFEEFIDYIGNSFRGMVHPDDLKEAESTINAQTLESGHRHDYLRYRIITKQGEIRYIEDFGHIVFDENGRGYYYVFIIDVEQQEFFNEYYNSFAEGQVDAMNWKVDHLTGLKNITAFQEELKNAAVSFRHRVFTVVVFDIIGLGKVNRNAGRNAGDRRIRSLVQAVYDHMPDDSLVFRGYDAEIIAICPGKFEQDLISRIEDTVHACQSRVFFGVASTAGSSVSDEPGRKETVLQAIEKAQYDLDVKKMLNEESARSQSLTSLVCALEEVDQDTEEHVMRTRNMGIALGKRLGLTDIQLTVLELMCLLHDIGKIAIPLEILNKPGKLTDAEWEVLRSHADKGYQIALASKELKPIAGYIRYHHERWDGRGYPTKLAGEDIPVLSRIISIVDAYDAMVNDRCYRKALSTEYAMKEIRDNAGTQFDPHMAMVFLELLSENPELAHGEKTGADEVRVFEKTGDHGPIVNTGNTQPVIYCEYKLDVDEKIIETDPSFEAITGYAPDDVLGKMSQFDLIPPEDLDDYILHVQNQFSTHTTAFLRHRIRRRDGMIINVMCHGERHFDSATRTFQSTIQIFEVENFAKEPGLPEDYMLGTELGSGEIPVINVKKKILIADDMESNREMLSDLLQEEYDFFFASDGVETLEILRRHKDEISLVLLDLIMPNMTGREVIAQMQIDEDLMSIPVVILTVDQAAELDCLKIGAMDFIPKPYPDIEIVKARIGKCIELYEGRELIRHTERDKLTGLLNKEYFFRYVKRLDYIYKPASLDAIVCDVNRLHSVNEQYGRKFGDLVIRMVGISIRKLARKTGGIGCREGGDVFLLCCPHQEDIEMLLKEFMADICAEKELAGRIKLRFGVFADAGKVKNVEERFIRARIAADSVKKDSDAIFGFYVDE